MAQKGLIAIFPGLFCPRGQGAMRLTPRETPTRETRPDRNIGNSTLCDKCVGSLTSPVKPCNTEDAGDGAYDL